MMHVQMYEQTESSHAFKHIDVDISCIKPNPYQPRAKFTEKGIEEIAASIRRFGVLQPLLVRDCCDGSYELIAGQRRIVGSMRAGLRQVPVIVKSASDLEMLEMSIIENLHREDMSPIDKAMGFKRLMEDFKMTQNQIANLMGISRPAVANAIRLLELPERIRQALHDKDITEGHARALLLIKDPKQLDMVLRRIIDRKMSVRETEELTKFVSKRICDERESKLQSLSNDEQQFMDKLRERLGTEVSLIKCGEGGRIVIEFYSEEHLERIAENL